MTAAAFKATYSDWKLVKTRSVVQIVFEVPLEQADAAYQVVGGMPDFGSEQWFAIAKLNGSTTEEREPEPVSNPPVRARKSWNELPVTSQIAIRCNEIRFQRFLKEIHPGPWKLMNEGTDAERAADIVRWICQVQSRRDIREGTEALDLWHELEDTYQGWLSVPV